MDSRVSSSSSNKQTEKDLRDIAKKTSIEGITDNFVVLRLSSGRMMEDAK
jgi:hypothetical protein